MLEIIEKFKKWYGGRGHVKWLTDVVVGGKSNDWLMWWQWASQMTDRCGGSGQVKWLTDVVAVGKSNDWLIWWQGQVKWLTNVVMQWHSGKGQVKWLTDVVAVGKSNDWLMWWCSNTLSLVLALSLMLSLVLALALGLALALEIRATWQNFCYLIFKIVICGWKVISGTKICSWHILC